MKCEVNCRYETPSGGGSTDSLEYDGTARGVLADAARRLLPSVPVNAISIELRVDEMINEDG